MFSLSLRERVGVRGKRTIELHGSIVGWVYSRANRIKTVSTVSHSFILHLTPDT
jgi:hypothetical protein